MSNDRQLDAMLRRVKFIGLTPKQTEEEITESVVAEIGRLRAERAVRGPEGGGTLAPDAKADRDRGSGT